MRSAIFFFLRTLFCALPAAAILSASVQAEEFDPSASTGPLAREISDVSRLAGEVEEGLDVSHFRLGWLIADTLSDLCRLDPGLDELVHEDGRMTVSYLRGPFSSRPGAEILRIGRLEAEAGSSRQAAARRAAGAALESLRHFTEDADGGKAEGRRREMAEALRVLRSALLTAAERPTSGIASTGGEGPKPVER